jgi:carbamoyltransferase
MILIGISAFYHDSAAAILVDGKVIAAAQEERFTRIRHDANFPTNAIKYVLNEANIKLEDVNKVIFYDKPLLKFERLLETYLYMSPKGFNSFRMAMPVWLKEKLFLKDLLYKNLKAIGENFNQEKISFSEHHLSHAASAFYPSPFDKAIILTLDGVGEWTSSSVMLGEKNKIQVLKEIHFPNSIGLLYSAFTYYTGFKVNSGEYKLMGLAPYGEPKYIDIIKKNLVDIKEDGSFRLDQKYFNYTSGLKMINNRFIKLFGEPVRKPEVDDINQFHMDIASSIQKVIEEIVIKMCVSLRNKYKVKNLCLAGGVALNCVSNGKIVKKNIFEKIWIQPASGDAGGAIGGALAYWHIDQKKPRNSNNQDQMRGSFLGPSFSNKEIETCLRSKGAVFHKMEYLEIINKTAISLSEQKAIGWFQGRMEFGPRALGARSILADPRSTKTQRSLNLKVKFRESFRPFGPAVLDYKAKEWFDINIHSPYMLLVSEVIESKKIKDTSGNELFGIDRLNLKRSQIPAVTHVDYSARLQTVHKETNKEFYDLLSKFDEITGCPVLVNTSFNIRGEPIVCNPIDAFNCFMGTNLDVLVIGNYFLEKKEQVVSGNNDYKNQYNLD